MKLKGILSAFVGLLVASTPAQAQLEGEGARCFYCSGETLSNGTQRHCDYLLNVAPGDDVNQGTLHPDCAGGYPTGLCNQHESYRIVDGGGGTSEFAWRKDHSDGALLRLFAENTNASLNIGRSAIQIADSDGNVVVHFPISKTQTARLRKAINAAALTTLQVTHHH